MRWPAVAAAALLAACATTSNPAPPARPNTPGTPASPALPPVPLVTGPLAPVVVYPVAGSLIESRDSNFIFGSVGNGQARLTINGASVPVYPNGAFLAFLPNPPPDSPRYELVASLGADTVRIGHEVRLSPAAVALSASGPLVIDSTSVSPVGRLALRDDDIVRVQVRAPPNAAVTWEGDDATARLVSAAATPGAPFVTGPQSITAPPPTTVRGPRAALDSSWFATELPARALRAQTRLVVTRDADTLRVPLAAIAPAPIDAWGTVGADSSVLADEDRELIGRPTPGGAFGWFLLPGTAVRITGWAGDYVRARLDSQLEIWLGASDVRAMPQGWAPARMAAGNARLEPAAEWVDLVVPMARRPAYLVEEGDRSLVLTLYDVASNIDVIHYGAGGRDSLVQLVDWDQAATDRLRITLRLSAPPYGYLARWVRGAFVLRVRRPPHIDPSSPLAGLTIAVDPGHPPIGATGPTGLWEPVPTLAIGLKVKTLLEARGAHVVMTRTTPDPVALGDRPIIARKANANALVSIHLNALPDGINPFTNNGTGAYYFRAHSIPLARALQRGMVARMGLRDLGINYDNLRLARPTWMPAVLCEGAFLMMPEQEAALRTDQFQEAYAKGVVDGLEAFFRGLVSTTAGSRPASAPPPSTAPATDSARRL